MSDVEEKYFLSPKQQEVLLFKPTAGIKDLVVVEDHEVGVADRDRSDLHGVGRGEFHESVAADTAHGNRIADDFEVVALGEFRRNEAGAAATRVEPSS